MLTMPACLQESAPLVEEELKHWFTAKGHDLSRPNVKSTIRTNTELIPKRGELILKALHQFTDVDLKDKRVLDIGCGFGVLSLYVQEKAQPKEVVAVDIDPSYIDTARNVAKGMGVDNISFYVDDMTRMSTPEGQFDVIILNNCFIYLPDTRDIKQSIAHFARLLKPGGTIIIYNPNRWHYREAFSKLIGVQFMPYWLANWYVKAKGKLASYDHLRLLSPWELTRFFKQAGFEQTQLISPYQGMTNVGWKRYFKPYFFFTAVKS